MGAGKVCPRQLRLNIAVNSLGPDTRRHSFQMRNHEIDKSLQHQGHGDESHSNKTQTVKWKRCCEGVFYCEGVFDFFRVESCFLCSLSKSQRRLLN